MSPEKLVEELNYCFQAFDEIVKEYNLEKIKTIGDAYMCVGGLPIPNSSHPQNAAKAAIAMMDFIQNRYKEKKALGENYWQMRIGLHSGPVVAGVVGSSKFVYDIWGDTVNTASRMESNSQAFKINLSGRTYELLNQHFNCNYRGKIKAKNKGEIDMYFLEERLS
jgi:class 3 adenylate cyclase